MAFIHHHQPVLGTLVIVSYDAGFLQLVFHRLEPCSFCLWAMIRWAREGYIDELFQFCPHLLLTVLH